MNVVMAQSADVTPSFVEVQGTGEHGTFSRQQLDALLGWPRGAWVSCWRCRQRRWRLATVGDHDREEAPLVLCLATQNRHKVEELQALLATLAPELHDPMTLTSLGELGDQ
jgi:hypothetical protein